ncbi:MFS transporter [Ammoniphilus sp. 3BR4]|uniref:MFS transporter n=1 Tax=Ammoniphilus sp. 3BR4 TaxID=3158265 RepID=UPI003467D8D4
MFKILSLPRNIRIIWFGQFFAISGLTIIVPLLPFYMTELGASDPADNRLWTGLSLAAPAVMLGLVSPVWGKCGDRWGRKWMVVRALLGLAASLALMAMAQSPLQFFLFRLLQGACGGIVDTASAFAVSEAPEKERGMVLGKLQSATAAGSLMGPLLGGIAADWIGFRPMLLTMGLLTGISGCLAVFFLQESKRKGSASADSDKKQTKWTLEIIDLLGHRRIRGFLIAGIFMQMGVFGLVTVFAPHVQGMSGLNNYASTWVGVLQAVTWAGSMAGSPWWGQRNDRVMIERNVFLASIGCGVSILLQAVPQQPEWLIPLRVCQGFCFAALVQSIFLAVTQESGELNRGVRLGAANSFLVMGQILGPLLAAAMGSILSTAWTIAFMGVCFFLGAASIRMSHSRQLAHAKKNREVTNEKWQKGKVI